MVMRHLWLVSIRCYNCLSEWECKGKHGLCADSRGVIGVEGEDDGGVGEGERGGESRKQGEGGREERK